MGCHRQGLQANIEHYLSSKVALREPQDSRPLVQRSGLFEHL